MKRGSFCFLCSAPLRIASARTVKSTAPHPHHPASCTRHVQLLTLAEPHKSPFQNNPQAQPHPHFNQQILRSFNNENDEFKTWSKDFIQLCDAQLSLLSSTVHNLEQVTLFFRHENSDTGALEFFPLIAHSSVSDDTPSRVWISFGAAGQTELEDTPSSRRLPGGIPAKWIFPDYPFTQVGNEGGILMPDGSLCIPIHYNNVLAGSLVLVPQKNHTPPPGQLWEPWSQQDITRSDMVGKSIALAAALETKSSAKEAMWQANSSLIDSIHMLLRTTLHQVRSPITALVTLGHLMLRRLPVGDVNRQTARSMIKEAMRVDDLLKPLDEAEETLALPAGAAVPSNSDDDNVAHPKQSVDIKTFSAANVFDAEQRSGFNNARQLIWLSDVLQPLSEIYTMIGEQSDVHFSADIDEDAPPVLAIEKFVREAISNLLDNSMKYSSPGSYAGLILTTTEEESESSVEVIVWDTGLGFTENDKDIVWDFGYRGSAAAKTGVVGSGIGLAVVRDMLDACNIHVELISPLPPHLDPRNRKGRNEESSTPGSAMVLRFQRPSRE